MQQLFNFGIGQQRIIAAILKKPGTYQCGSLYNRAGMCQFLLCSTHYEPFFNAVV